MHLCFEGVVWAHACVRLPVREIKQLYLNIEVAQTVCLLHFVEARGLNRAWRASM